MSASLTFLHQSQLRVSSSSRHASLSSSLHLHFPINVARHASNGEEQNMAAWLVAVNTLKIQPFNLPTLGPYDARVRMKAVGICGSDVHYLKTLRSRVQFFKISALSLMFCASVVSGNVSLRYFPVSFTQTVGATTPFFTAVFAYVMTMKREAWLTYVTLIPVVTGVVIASGGEPSFHLFGFIMCLGATAARALKSVLQGILLSLEGKKLNSMNLLLYMAPVAVVILLPATLLMEDNVVGITIALARKDVNIVWYLLFNSALAYLVNLTNFLVTKHTSALTLQVPNSLFDLHGIMFGQFGIPFWKFFMETLVGKAIVETHIQPAKDDNQTTCNAA